MDLVDEQQGLAAGVGLFLTGFLDDLADFVVDRFDETERLELGPLWPIMVEAVECWITEGIEEAMGRFNRTRPRATEDD